LESRLLAAGAPDAPSFLESRKTRVVRPES
jgi:hypothetical protein